MKKILIIDDNHQNRLLIKMILQKKGYTVIEAESGEKGLALAFEQNPDLIILDMMMPEVDGWEVMERLKENSKTENIPIIIFSALDDLESIEADGFIPKPVDVNRLIQTVSEVIG
ncbi:MAG TPA: response regulator [Persephonella sp.]|uniref:Cell division response regulator DivK n=1 Tax=Persephonella marina (strain DSM 14350 / EX-H1) TaxID=123214 RepID=C0QRG9_PERMH|nr:MULTISPECIES: response regulator [Persephonella]ACO03406.1 cell division response regulator DivK [Persephonella marina EX-H1]HCB69011.1 response regulator [Persephonella sp.]